MVMNSVIVMLGFLAACAFIFALANFIMWWEAR